MSDEKPKPPKRAPKKRRKPGKSGTSRPIANNGSGRPRPPPQTRDTPRARAKDPDNFIQNLQADAERELKKARILDLMAEAAMSVTGAAKEAEVSRQTVYRWCADDPTFARDCELAYQAGTDALKDEASRRAMAGSDQLLINAIKGRDASWRDTKVAPFSLAQVMAQPANALSPDAVAVPISRLQPEELAALRKIAERIEREDAERKPLTL